MTTVSVVVPAHNEEETLPSCLAALLLNVAPLATEILVVDNCSSDATAIAAAAFPGVGLAFERRKGITRARQRGFESTTGDILAFVDADTLPPAGWIDEVIERFEADPALACLSGPYSFHDVNGMMGRVSRWWFILPWLLGRLGHAPIIGGNFAIRRDVLAAMGGFDQTIEFYGEDADIARRARRHGRVVFSRTLVMPTSGRRMVHEGYVRTAAVYALNYVSVATTGRPVTRAYADVRRGVPVQRHGLGGGDRPVPPPPPLADRNDGDASGD